MHSPQFPAVLYCRKAFIGGETIHISVLAHKSPHKKEIEDAFCLSEDLCSFGVFDGVTPLNGEVWSGGHNGAYLASRMLAASLHAFQKSDPLSEWLFAANTSLLTAMMEAGVDLEERHYRWSSCAAAVRISGDQAEYVQCGDCMILREDDEGVIHQVTVNSVQGISERAIEFRKSLREKGLLSQDESFYDDPAERMKFNRSLANRPAGYSVVNGDQELRSFVQEGAFSIKNTKSFLLISDGFFHPEMDLTDSYKEIKSVGLEAYAQALRFHEYTNRLHHDDMTAIYAEF
nr:protein phosphatase 2C domain-containing protein [Metabacillus mangrovi]